MPERAKSVSGARKPSETIVLKKLAQRQDSLEDRLEMEARVNADHRQIDATSFSEVRTAIASSTEELQKALTALGNTLQIKIGGLQEELRTGLADVAQLKTDKLKSEAFSEGFKSAKQPNPWMLQIAPVVVGAIIAALGAWIAHDFYSPASAEQRATVITSTTVEHHK